MISKISEGNDVPRRAGLYTLDRDKTGFVTLKQLRNLSKKLSKSEVKALMVKVSQNIKI